MRKITAVSILIFGLLLGWAQVRARIAESYLQRSQEISGRNPASTAALSAAAASVRLAPWRADAHAALSWRLQNSGTPAEARRQFTRALSVAPADAFLWAEYARLLARQRKFGREMELATHRSNRLGPSFSTIQWSNATTGLYFWSRGSRALQQEWLNSMKFMLRNDHSRFLQKIRSSGRIQPFCLGPGAELSLIQWCAQMDRAT